MRKPIGIEEMLNLSPYEFSNRFFVRKVNSKPAWNRGMKMPEIFCKKISDSQKGINRVSFDARSKAQRGRKKSIQHRLNLSKARKGRIGVLGDNGRARAVICPAGSFATIKEGAIAMNCDGGTFRSRIRRGVSGYGWGPDKSGSAEH